MLHQGGSLALRLLRRTHEKLSRHNRTSPDGELAATKSPRNLIQHGIDHSGFILVDEGVGDVDVFGNNHPRRHVVAMTKLIGACAQHCAQDRLDAFERPAFRQRLVDQRIEAVLRAVLRAGAYELDRRTDVPARAVISEYVGVANAFVDKDETGMVNAVLDQIARRFRSGEFTAR